MAAGGLRGALRAQTTRWVAALLLALTGMLASSVGVALRTGDANVAHEESGAVSYAALDAAEVRFDVAGAPLADPTLDAGPGTERTERRRTTDDDDDGDDDDDDDDRDDDDGDERDEQIKLRVTVSADRTEAEQGERIAYAFSVTNVWTARVENVVATFHVPSGTYAAGACNGITDEATLQPPACADVPGLPATGTDDYHVARAIGAMAPGDEVTWNLFVRVGADTVDGAEIASHAHAMIEADRYTSDSVWVLVR